ncbi:MAG TPA: peptidoglycan DD-metalloendopeptidase family protein [Candidatus Stackebrandtia faecavium]|nr:peptidoglycan DD-metalloendopeptidase family protein [Candidatus Stackebrandtia faecavium]
MDNSARKKIFSRRNLLITAGAGTAAAAVGIPTLAFADSSAQAAWSNPAIGTITSGYMTPGRPNHAGTDVANNQGTNIHAAKSGTVTAVRTNSYPGDKRQGLLPGRTGNGILIDHGGGYVTYYGHLYSAAVSKGTKVSTGQVIAAMGTTGNSTGPHLHFEVHKNGSTTNPYDFMASQGITLGSTPPTGGGSSWPDLKKGASGGRVKVAQYLLCAHGISTVIDGDYGSVTVANVKKFQKKKGLVQDGWIGALSWAKLVIDVKNGKQGDAAKAAQTGLNRHGAGLEIDGDFGSVSVAATKAFQKKKGLVQDGWVGALTWAALVK